MVKSIQAYPRYVVEDPSFAPQVPHVIISITTPWDNPADIPDSDHRLDILRLSFHDLDKDKFQGQAGIFSDDDARTIWDFVLRNKTADAIIVHCDMGASRSPGVAAAISKVLLGDDMVFFKTKTPNMLVFRTMLNVWYDEYDV